ncbi:MAG: hypothetical protein MUF28_09635 [Ignavibacterium sp.]|jgi:hypothetical protein|nr:hypothetical protein [Ignavibacterium sp.]
MKKFIIICFFIVFIPSIAFSQSNSVYTRAGIGDLEYGYSAKMIGIGNIGATQLDPDHLIVSNPASWSVLSRTRIEFGLGYRGTLLSDGEQENYTSETEFKGVTFGVPVSREYGIGAVIGLVPYSRISYSAEKYYPADDIIPSYNLFYEGTGGLSKIFLGSSFFLPFGFAGGVTLDYYFGNQNYATTIKFDDPTYISTKYENVRRSTGFGTTLGLISSNLAREFRIGGISDLRLGFSYSYVGDLDTDSLFTQTSLFLVDSITNTKAEMKIPARITAGISFAIEEEYNFALDFLFQPMSQYSFNGQPDGNLKDDIRYSTAFEYKPRRTLGMSTWEQIIWRFGLSYEQTQYTFNGTDINQFSVFGGMSYPFGPDNTIDLAIEYLNKGTNDNNLIHENAIKIYIGLSFGELWFLRYDK